MKKKIAILLKCICFLFCFVNCTDESRLDVALKKAGKNRVQLEKVLNHYITTGDNLKYKAACFLIENMPRYYSYKGNPIEQMKKSLLYLVKYDNELPDSLISLTNNFSESTLTKVYDIEIMTANYLIEHIERCFFNWKERPWNKNLSFDDFCEYLLPYRIGFEPLEEWMEAYAKKYVPLLDSLYSGTDVIEAANMLSLYIGKTEKIIFNSDLKYLNPGAIFYLNCKSGNCFDLRNAAVYMLRSVGIPAVADFYRFSPTEGIEMHTWVNVRDTTGNGVVFRGLGLEISRNIDLEDHKGKIYRECFGKQYLPTKLINDYQIPAFFRSSYIKDVTENYTGKNSFEVEVPGIDNKYVYLGVHTSWRTGPIAITKARKGKASFKNVEKEIIYQLFTIENGILSPSGYPVLFGKNKTHVFLADTSNLQKVYLYRKYFLADWLYNYMNYMINGQLEGATDREFSNKTFVFHVQDSIEYINVKRFIPDENHQTRFIRFTSPLNRRIDLAEVSFYTSQGLIEPNRIHLTGGPSLKVYKNGALKNISDQNPLTYYASADTEATVVFSLDSAYTLSCIDIMPRTDDNFIRIGDIYELYYHAGVDGWKSLGHQKAKDYYLQYDNVPSNSLLWLQNHTRGKEEQVFYMRNGKQIFTGRR